MAVFEAVEVSEMVFPEWLWRYSWAIVLDFSVIGFIEGRRQVYIFFIDHFLDARFELIIFVFLKSLLHLDGLNKLHWVFEFS